MQAAQDFTEYCAALTATAVYNVNRKKDSRFLTPDVLMVRSQHRRKALPIPIDQPPVRYAAPGERPPSRRPGQSAIDAFDAHVKRSKHG